MLDDQRPGTVYWIDHYVVGSDDLPRWADFMTKVIGAQAPEGPARNILFQDITHSCHHGAQLSPDPLPPSEGLGKGLPRHGLYIRQADIEQHLRRLDEYNVPHLDPIRTSAEGDEVSRSPGRTRTTNQFEFWAPDRLPEGAMAGETSVGVGRISHGVFECADLQRAADHFAKYAALEPMVSADIPSDTLVLPLVKGPRIVYKQVDHSAAAPVGSASCTPRTSRWSSVTRTSGPTTTACGRACRTGRGMPRSASSSALARSFRPAPPATAARAGSSGSP